MVSHAPQQTAIVVRRMAHDIFNYSHQSMGGVNLFSFFLGMMSRLFCACLLLLD
jgi:hypothetical protein